MSKNPLLDKISPRRIVVLLISVIAFGATFYHYVEGLSWLDSIYFCVITLATVGYGDITPQTPAGKIFTMFYILIGLGMIAGTANYLLRHAAKHQIAHHIAKHLAREDSPKIEKKN